jgi:hypothetical protein
MIWPPPPLWFGDYLFRNVKEVLEEFDTMAIFHFGEERFYEHNPSRTANKLCQTYKYKWSYESEAWEEDEIHKREMNYGKVIFKRGGIS